ncbi:MAG: cardiolipin synthase [Bdellovibrio sp.]
MQNDFMSLLNFTLPTDLNFWGVLYFLVEIFAISFAIKAVITARTSQGAIAWAISLVVLPWITIPIYLVFGTHRLEAHLLRRRRGEEFVGRDALDLSLLKDCRCTNEEIKSHQVLEKLSLLPFLKGNKLKLLINGHQTFETIFQAIDQAKHYVLIQFFIVDDDDLGMQLKQKLIAARARNVRVFFLYDAIGSRELDGSYVDELHSHGVEIHSFRLGKRAYPWQINFRNHRKIVVVDGLKAYVGGHNVGDEYVDKDPKLSPWRDTHVEIIGPAATALQIPFLEDWYWSTEKIPKLIWKPEIQTENQSVLIFPTGPADQMESCGLFFTHLINHAKSEIWIASPYFVPDGKIQSALKLAALSGVDVRIMLPEKPDHVMVYWARYDYLNALQSAGVKFYFYRKGFLHQKVLQVDGEIACVGTANLDNRSFRLNFEVQALSVDKKFSTEVRDMLLNDFSHCELASIYDLKKRTIWERIIIKFSRLFSPIL